ncbi:Flagellin [Pelagimonas phthalicica]|uniref:Flagellin n=1 Tax=Pelagimonas phthalicica TaxID=1037362 RepID=A0A238J708_9RHOB|nr:flagellin [Pelagimonas phthalicica]TDS95353.1 flagellin [Pelagimonas phthalicica]SMX26123.1 Flagellin [Pelagimonas phthalicica]
MSSILTNNGAMVALQTLKSINSNMADTQSKISTGKAVANAKDNSAVWAISKVMEADVKGFKGISDSLNLGQSTVAVARQASETVTDLLTDIKGKIVAAQEENVDRDKIQTDIAALRDQIGAVVGAAQFNGLNLLDNKDTTAGSNTINVLASLDRSATGVAASDISVAKQDLGITASEITGAGGGTEVSGAAVGSTVALNGAATAPTTSFTIVAASVAAGVGYTIELTAGAGDMATANTSASTGHPSEVMYVAREGDTNQDVFDGLNDALKTHLAGEGLDADDLSMSFNASTGLVTVTGSSTTGNNITVEAESYAAAGNTIGGGLGEIEHIDVTTQEGVDSALTAIEGLIQTAVDSAANFGSAQGRIETQADFISGLTDALKSGIGSLVDADMEETSARLQALQVQQQLGVQALSIANQAPQQLLSLFR